MRKVLLHTFILVVFSSAIYAQNDVNATISTVGYSSETNYNPLLEDLLNDCIELDEVTDKLILMSLENTRLFEDIIVSPNPSSDMISFEIPEGYTYIDIKIFDAQAQQILHQRKTMGLQSIDLQKLAAGIYFMHIISQDKLQKKTFKIVKR